MSDKQNTSRFFQLAGPMLFEYEFNEKFDDTRSDEYGKFPIGEFEPFVMRMLDGSYVYSDTRKSSKLTTNNYIYNTSLAYDSKPSWWFRFKGNDSKYTEYSDMNVNFGVLSALGLKNCGTLYMSNEIIEHTVSTESEESYNSFLSVLNASIRVLYGDEELEPCDVRIYNTLTVSPVLKSVLKLCIDLRGEESLFRYFDDDYEGINDITLTYKEIYNNLLEDITYYDYTIEYDELGFPKNYKSNLYDRLSKEEGFEDWDLDVCVKFSERVIFSVCCELYGVRDKKQVLAYNTGIYKYTSLDYSEPEIQELLSKAYQRTENENVSSFSTNDKIPFDTYRIYFIGGYFLNDIYGIRLRVSVNNNNGDKVVLSDLFFSKETDIPYIYLTDQPLYVSNKIYDKYIEVKVPSVKYICTDYAKELGGEEFKTLAEDLDVSYGSPVIVEFSCISSSDIKTYNGDEEEVFDATRTIKNMPLIPEGKTAYLYQQSNTVSCSLAQSANSDNIGAHITIPEGKNYVEFGGTWKGDPLTWDIINMFNRAFPIYDIKTRRNIDYYNADDTSTVEWVGYHEIVAKYYGAGGSIVDGYEANPLYVQRYNFTQMFGPNNDDSDFMQYRPIIKRKIKIDGKETDINVYGVLFEYTFRLMNVVDDVQFIKKASFSVSTDDDMGISEFFNDTMVLDVPINTFNVYNKIEEIKNTISNPISNPIATKYTKVFYNSNNITLNADGTLYGNGTYSIKLSDAPKNYKFTFRKYDEDGNLTVYDMSDSAYKLYSRDAYGRDIIIEPTYSDNMNSAMGEIEFNISINNVQKLKEVDSASRFMSIIVVNQDNTQYSMFDFTYE